MQFALLKIAKFVLVAIHAHFKLQPQFVNQLFDFSSLPTIYESEAELSEQLLSSLEFFLLLLLNAKLVKVWLLFRKEKLFVWFAVV